MRGGAHAGDALAIFFSRLLPFLTLLCLWLLFAGTGLYWGGAKIYESIWLFYLAAVLWLLFGIHAVRVWSQGKRVGGWVDLPVLAFLFYLAVWYHFTPIEFLTRIEGLWALTYGAVFLSVRYMFPQRGWLIVLLAGFLVVALICCGFALSKLGQSIYPIWGENRPDYGGRISGFFGCPNHFGNFMVMGALIAVVMAGISSFPWVVRICFFYIFGMLSAGVFLSLSRGSYGAWLAGMLVVAGVFFYRSTLGWMWKAAVALGAMAAVGGSFLINEAAVNRGSQMLHDDFRFKLFSESWNLWQTKPIFGHGPATFDFVHQRFHGPEFISRAYFTHNDYLNTLCDYGAIGLGIVLVFVVLVALAFRAPKESTLTERQQDLAVLGWATLTALLVHEMVDFNFHIPACALGFCAIMGVASSRTERQQRAPLCLPFNFLLAGTALVAAFFLITATWKTRAARAILPYTDDGLLELQPDRLMGLVTSARAWDPYSPFISVRGADAMRVHVAGLADKIVKLRQSTTPKEKEAAEMEELLTKRQERGEDALRLYRLAEKANTLDDTLRIKQGMVLDLLDRPQEAYLYYQQAIQKQPNNLFFVHVLGYHFLRTGNFAKARECFKRVMSVGSGRGQRNRETLDQASEALKMIDGFEKQRTPPPQSLPPAGPAVPLPAPVAPPVVLPSLPARTETSPPESPASVVPDWKKGPDRPILGPSREGP